MSSTLPQLHPEGRAVLRTAFLSLLTGAGKLRKVHVTPLMDATVVTRAVRGEPMPHVRQTRILPIEGDEPCEPETALAITAGTADIQERQ